MRICRVSTRNKIVKFRGISTLMALGGGLIVSLVFLIPVVAGYLLRIDRGLGDKVLFPPGIPEPMPDLVFLGIDEDSLTLQGLGEEMIANEENLSRMAERFPWDRRVYANALEKLLEAGARMVVIDLIFSEPSEPEADAELVRIFQKYGDRIVIASSIAPMSVEGAGFMLLEPHSMFLDIDPAPKYGYVNFRPDQEDGLVRVARVHDHPDRGKR